MGLKALTESYIHQWQAKTKNNVSKLLSTPLSGVQTSRLYVDECQLTASASRTGTRSLTILCIFLVIVRDAVGMATDRAVKKRTPTPISIQFLDNRASNNSQISHQTGATIRTLSPQMSALIPCRIHPRDTQIAYIHTPTIEWRVSSQGSGTRIRMAKIRFVTPTRRYISTISSFLPVRCLRWVFTYI